MLKFADRPALLSERIFHPYPAIAMPLLGPEQLLSDSAQMPSVMHQIRTMFYFNEMARN
jgi:hypothetical protein